MSQSSSYETIDLIENYLLMKTAWYLIFSRSTIQARDGHDRVIDYSGGDRVGVLGSGPPHFLAVWGSTCTWTPHFYLRAAAANRLWPIGSHFPAGHAM